jgi:SGNH domain-containing protein
LSRLSVAAHDWRYPGPSMRRLTTDDGLIVQRVGSAPRKIVVYGDSNAQQYGPRIEALVAAHPERTVEVLFAATGSCAPLPGLRVDGSARCADYARSVDALIARADVDGVVLIAQWPGYAFNSQFTLPGPAGDEVVTPQSPALSTALASLRERIARWRAAGKRVYIVAATPSAAALDPRSLLVRDWRGEYRIEAAGVARSDWDRRNTWIAERLAMVARDTGATFVDPTPSLCTPAVCPAVTADGEPIYRDAAHLRAAFVRDYVDYLDAIILDSR